MSIEAGARKGVVFLAIALFLFASRHYCFGGDNETRMGPPQATASEIESAIAQLSMPLEASALGKVQGDIMRSSPADQARLHDSLDAKLKELQGAYSAATVPTAESVNASRPEPTSAAPLPQDIISQIDALDLGRDASVEQVRKKDALVATISALNDTNVKYDLLDYLRNKEQAIQQ